MAQISKCKQMFLKHLKRATPLLFPESRRLQVTLCPNSAKGKTPTPFGVNFQEKCNSPFVGFPQVAGDVRDQVVPRIRAGQGANSRARARRDSHVPLPRWAQGELVVATVGRRLFLFTALAAGWPRCTGVGGDGGARREMVGAPGYPPSEPPADCHARGTRGRSCDLHPPPKRQSLESGVAPTLPVEVSLVKGIC